MEEFINGITLPWVLSVVVVSFLVNLFSSYFRDAIDKLFSIFSEKWRNRTKSKQEKWNQKVKELQGNKEAQDITIRNEFRNRIHSIYLFLVGVGTLTIASSLKWVALFSFWWFISSVLYILSYLLLLKSISTFREATNDMQLISDVRKLEKNKIEYDKAEDFYQKTR